MVTKFWQWSTPRNVMRCRTIKERVQFHLRNCGYLDSSWTQSSSHDSPYLRCQNASKMIFFWKDWWLVMKSRLLTIMWNAIDLGLGVITYLKRLHKRNIIKESNIFSMVGLEWCVVISASCQGNELSIWKQFERISHPETLGFHQS